jgi:hypothetical protein
MTCGLITGIVQQNRSPCNGNIMVHPEVSDTTVNWIYHVNFFFEAIMLMNYKPHKTTNTGCVYAAVLQNSKEAIKEKL